MMTGDKLTLLVAAAIASGSVFAAPKPKNKPQEQKRYAGIYQQGSEFELDSNLVDKIYEQTSATKTAEHGAADSTLGLKLSLAQFENVKLGNRYYDVDYSENADPNPILAFEVSYLMTQFRGTKLYLDTAAGFGYREDIYSAKSNEGIAVQDNLAIQVLPVSVAAKISHRIPRVPISVLASFGGGTEWLKQTGTLDGMSQNAWIPFYVYSFGAKFFEPDTVKSMTFSGLSLGMSRYQDLSNENDLTATSFDVTSGFYL